MKSQLLEELEQVLRDEVTLLATGQVDNLAKLLHRKLQLVEALREAALGPYERGPLVRVWRKNRSLLQTLKPFIPDRNPSAQSRRLGGWRS